MSTQSGILVSPDLYDAFKNLKSQALIIKISPDSTLLIPDSNFTSPTTNDTSKLFTSVYEYISQEFPHPSYIVISEDSDVIFISFIPDVAPIKQKMLYASTKNTLLSSLGSYNFPKNKTFAWTELNELNWDNYKLSVDDTTTGPLSKDEEIIRTLNNLQDLHLSSQTSLDHGFKKELPSIHDSSSGSGSGGGEILGKFTPELQQEFDSLKDNISSHKLITFNIKGEEEIVLNNSETDIRLIDLIPSLTKSQAEKPTPMYAIYNYQVNKFAFIYSCPSGSPVRERMIYAASKLSLINHLNEILTPLSIDKNLEIGDLDELELSLLEGDSEVATPSSISSTNSNRIGLKFNKPKGPRRR